MDSEYKTGGGSEEHFGGLFDGSVRGKAVMEMVCDR